MKNVNILKVEQGNEFYDASKLNNGGGYDQPIITFEYKGIQGVYEDTSCGDFGTRESVEWDGKYAQWGSMIEEENHYSEIPEADLQVILNGL